MAAQNRTDSTESGNVFTHHLSSKTSILGLKVYTIVGICVGLALLAVLSIFICVYRKSRNRRMIKVKHASGLIPMISKDITEVKKRVPSAVEDPSETGKKDEVVVVGGFGAERVGVVDLESGKRSAESKVSGGSGTSSSAVSGSDASNLGWGRWYALTELEAATEGFNSENVIGEGGYGVVYRGVLPDNSVVAVKNLLNNKGQAEREFKVEVEAIGKVRHKNLVGLLGYCADGAKRMLVYEYVDNGNLEQWLHGDVGPVSPLSWDIRMKIAIGTAKGLAYLHEGLEPKVVHRDIKSSNILLDRHWNPKVSDFGLAKLLGSESSYVTTRVMGTFGYVAPEYASTGMLNEGSDVYSFGVLLMEIISGRSPVDYGRPSGEVNLVEWFKGMVGSRRGEEVLDSLIDVQPPPRALKRVLLVCLRCIDLDAQKRPKMGQVVHMLEADEFPFRSELRNAQAAPRPSQGGQMSAVARIPFPTPNAGGDAQERSNWR